MLMLRLQIYLYLFSFLQLSDFCIDKLYINGKCGSITLSGVLLAHFEGVSHVSHSSKDTIPMRDPKSVRLGTRLSLFQCLQYEWARNFVITKNIRLTIYPSISS